ncbi:MAG: hypothetical protein FWC41_14205 [Firmicutes bacterium]|nr:hypothetical protein [Bacillota bacterium]
MASTGNKRKCGNKFSNNKYAANKNCCCYALCCDNPVLNLFNKHYEEMLNIIFVLLNQSLVRVQYVEMHEYKRIDTFRAAFPLFMKGKFYKEVDLYMRV